MIIREFLPNPAGKDSEGEYILLFNDSNGAVNLSGWSLKDASSKTFWLSGTLAPQTELKLFGTQTKISLNNNGETVSLFNASGQLADSLAYSGTAAEEVPIFKAGELTPEIKERLFDNLPGRYTAQAAGSIDFNFWIIMVLGAVVLASLGVYIHKHIKENVYEEIKFED